MNMNGRLLLAVVIILCVVPEVRATSERSSFGAAHGDIGAFNSALALYQVDVDSKCFPDTLAKLLRDDVPGWSGPYMATITRDPWGCDYQYQSNGKDYTISLSHSRESGIDIHYCMSQGVMVDSSLPYAQRNQAWFNAHPSRLYQARRREQWFMVGGWLVLTGVFFLTLHWSHRRSFRIGGIVGALFGLVACFGSSWAVHVFHHNPLVDMMLLFFVRPSLYLSFILAGGESMEVIAAVAALQWYIVGGFIGRISRKDL